MPKQFKDSLKTLSSENMLIERVTDIMARYDKGLSISTNEKIITEHLIIQQIRDHGRKTDDC